ncbi:MAG: hypothetical protein QM756_39435 [Polyangiaceae bacterium]
MTRTPRLLGLIALCALSCENKPSGSSPAPSASVSAKAAAAAVEQGFGVESAGSSVSFQMESPLEKIHGEAIDAVRGELRVNLSHIEQSTGSIEVDLDKLSLSQQRRKDEKHDYSPSARNDAQNREAREWLQLEAREGEIAEEQAKRNRLPKFTLERLENPSASDVQGLSGAERNVGASARGSLLLHGRTNKQTVKLDLTFVYAGERVEAIRVKTSEPLRVALEAYDVNPRTRTGKLVKTIQEALAGEFGKKLRSEVLLELSFTAKPR